MKPSDGGLPHQQQGAAPDEDEEDVPMLVALPEEDAQRQQADLAAAVAAKVVPVTILTGCLGAGKTTLLNYILTQPHGKRIAVIENEFGQGLGIESAIARDGTDGSSLQEFFELSNGCICCSVKSDLVLTLESLLQRKADIDVVLIETSGVAHPGPVAACLWLDEALESQLRLDGIVTVVDVKHIGRQLDDKTANGQAAMQIGFADRILVNKVDTVAGEAQVAAVEERLRRMNGVARLQRTTRSQVDLDFVLGLSCYDGDRTLPPLLPVHCHDQEQGCRACDEETYAHEHAEDVSTVALVEEGAAVASEEALTRWLGGWLWPKGEGGREKRAEGVEVFRVKGVVSVEGGQEGVWVVQGVFEAFEVRPARSLQWGGGAGPRGCRLVLIGKGVAGAREQIRSSFLQECCCLHTTAAAPPAPNPS